MVFIKRVLLYLTLINSCFAETELARITTYAQSLPEFPESDNQDWFDPDYTSLYEKLQPTFIKRFTKLFYDESWWQPKQFIATLEEVTKLKTPCSGQEVCVIDSAQESTVIVWGDLFGSFHVLVKALHYFKEQGIIDDQLKIIKPHYYMVFLGNAVDRSPYSHDTLYLIALLIKANPDKIFYLRGEHEDKDYWLSFGTMREIRTRITSDVLQGAKTITILNTFFAAQPKVLLYKLPSQDVVEFTYNPSALDENLLKRNAHISKIRAIIQGQGDVKINLNIRDLEKLPLKNKAFVWKTFSAMNDVYKKFAGRKAGSFVILSFKDPFDESTISSYTITDSEITKKDSYLLVKGEKEAISKTREAQFQEVLLGSVMDLEKQNANIGQRLRQGMVTCFAHHNAAAPKHFFRLHILNDNHVPYMARKAVFELISDYKIEALVAPLGNVTLKNYYHDIEQQKIPLFFPVAGSSLYRNPDLRMILHFRPSYEEEVVALIKYIMQEYRAENFAFFYQNDELGRSTLEAAHDFLRKSGITKWLDIPYMRGQLNFTREAELLDKFKVEAIGFFSVEAETKAFITQVGLMRLYDKQCFAHSWLSDEAFKLFMRSKGLSCTFASAVANPQTSMLEIVQKYRKTFDDGAKTDYSVYELEGYITASLLIDAYSKYKHSVDAHHILSDFEKYKNYSFEGLTLTFNPRNRSLSQPVWIDDGQDWIAVFPENNQSPTNIQPNATKKTADNGSPMTIGPKK